MALSWLNRLLKLDKNFPDGAGCTEAEKLFLFSLVQLACPSSILEIGTSAGHSTCWLAAGLSAHRGVEPKRMVSVDNWKGSFGSRAIGPKPARERLVRIGLGTLVNLVAADSKDYLETCSRFDMIWIDGDHSFEGALTDCRLACAKAQKIIVVHDANEPTVRRACEKAFENFSNMRFNGAHGFWITEISIHDN